MKVTAILKGTPDKLGRQTITIRINQGDDRKFKATKMKITPAQWDSEAGKVVKHPQAALYNQNIKNLTLQIEVRHMNEGVALYPDADFFAYCEKCNEAWEGEKDPETLRQHRYELSKIRQFRDSFSLSDITPAFLELYKAWMKKRGNESNTLWKSFKFLKMIIRKAKKEKVIRDNPFDVFEAPKYRDPKKQYLTGDQLATLEAFVVSGKCSPELRFVGTWFLIGCFTGLRFGDMKGFVKKDHIRHGRLVLYTSKTQEVVSLPLDDRLKALFERVEFKPLSITNQYYNRAIKTIMEKAEVAVKVSAHTSRHSFAVLCASVGISQEMCARYLGHTNLRTTAIYYKLTNARGDEEYKKLGGSRPS